VRDRHEDLLRILALESVRERFLVVGEDLGTVPDSVRDWLARFGVLSYRLLYFERDREGSFRAPAEYPAQALVAASTHDLPTLAGFWTNRDIEARRAAGLVNEEGYRAQLEARARDKQRLLDRLHQLNLLPPGYPQRAADLPELTGEIHNALIGFLASTPSVLMLINEEDLTKETEQQNLPGSTHQYPNWRRKTLFSIEDFQNSRQVEDYAAMFRHWLARTGRTNQRRA
jgi:4-alpha-glucanotransferase